MQFPHGSALKVPYDTDATLPSKSLTSMEWRELAVFCKGLPFSAKTFRSISQWAFLSGNLLSSYCPKGHRIHSSMRASNARLGVECQFTAQTLSTLLEPESDKGLLEVSKHKISKLDDELLQKSIAYEAERGFANCMGRKTRFGDFLSMKLFTLSCTNSSQDDSTLVVLSNSAKTYENMTIDDRVALIDKVCGLLGFRSIQDLVDHQIALMEASRDLQMNTSNGKGLASCTLDKEEAANHDNLKAKSDSRSLMLQKVSHPSIVFGSSEPIELYKSSEEGKGSSSLSEVLENCLGRRKQEDSVNTCTTELSDLCKPKDGNAAAPDFYLHANIELENSKSRHVLQKVDGKQRTCEPKKKRKAAKRADTSDTYEGWLLNKPISLVKSLSPYLCSRLDEHGFHTLRKLLQHYPRTYLNFQQAGARVEDGQYLTFFGRIISSKGFATANLGILEVLVASAVDQNSGALDRMPIDKVEDGNGVKSMVVLHTKRFFRGARFANRQFLSRVTAKYPQGAHVAVSGKVRAMDEENHFEMKEFNVELYKCDEERGAEASLEKPYPVYPTKAGLDAKTIEMCIRKVLPDVPLDIDPLPEKFRMQNKLMELRQAYVGIHCPSTLGVAEKARERFVFDEFLYLQLGLLLQRKQLVHSYLKVAGEEDSVALAEAGTLDMEKWAPLTLKLLESLPFKLTNSQIKCASEIMWDLQRPVPMSRLLQGDVGCGKTIVAFLALMEVIDAGYQGALMGPTEFLARQHYERFVSLLEHLDDRDRPQIALLTSSVPGSKARAIRKGLESGEIQLAVGTHSLIAESVKFASLGLAVIDEQHRFGVAQRIRLNNKGIMMNAGESSNGSTALDADSEKGTKPPNIRPPHVLAMSATPIPRTLAFAMHGDMALGQITEIPPGRTPIKTYAMMGDEDGLKSAFELVRNELQRGGRAFIVYSIIGESEEMPSIKAATVEFEKIVEEFSDYKCGLVHGKLRPNEKEDAMNSFKCGETQVLVSTTVVEVGIDIPEASIMVVVNAERYGMAQLHQLRGRVGRGVRESTCVLLASSLKSLERLKILERSRDGFYLAEMDLRLRGPGDLLGKQQSGHMPEFSLARLEDDGELMIQARNTAEDILNEYPHLEGLPRLKQELSFRRAPSSFGL